MLSLIQKFIKFKTLVLDSVRFGNWLVRGFNIKYFQTVWILTKISKSTNQNMNRNNHFQMSWLLMCLRVYRWALAIAYRFWIFFYILAGYAVHVPGEFRLHVCSEWVFRPYASWECWKTYFGKYFSSAGAALEGIHASLCPPFKG